MPQFISLTEDQMPTEDQNQHAHGHGRRGSTHEPLGVSAAKPKNIPLAPAKAETVTLPSDAEATVTKSTLGKLA
ncbi:hypothetical protein K450DRAFT_220097 [Umbelopsis ramanniana AG]|uniref:Uncharacterized protein n=1 Tax=Umbelopsis ramanniana AG TaxID=1314678 RepID=A0AAD5HI82_UMBRA|nr:uncharacterized protein K450DRAFT_220097 [Umbelopsis ramanniana AG]KAI8583814.1 hypothetical protein K450DRAFT_220097 [Umbelopsis ramanniana AG]